MEPAQRILLTLLATCLLSGWSQSCEIDFHTEAAALMVLAGDSDSILCDATSCEPEVNYDDNFLEEADGVTVIWRDPRGREISRSPSQIFSVAYRSAPMSRLVAIGAGRDIEGQYVCSVMRSGVVIQERAVSVIVFDRVVPSATTTTRRPRRRRPYGRRRGDQIIEEEREITRLYFRPVRSASRFAGLAQAESERAWSKENLVRLNEDWRLREEESAEQGKAWSLRNQDSEEQGEEWDVANEDSQEQDEEMSRILDTPTVRSPIADEESMPELGPSERLSEEELWRRTSSDPLIDILMKRANSLDAFDHGSRALEAIRERANSLDGYEHGSRALGAIRHRASAMSGQNNPLVEAAKNDVGGLVVEDAVIDSVGSRYNLENSAGSEYQLQSDDVDFYFRRKRQSENEPDTTTNALAEIGDGENETTEPLMSSNTMTTEDASPWMTVGGTEVGNQSTILSTLREDVDPKNTNTTQEVEMENVTDTNGATRDFRILTVILINATDTDTGTDSYSTATTPATTVPQTTVDGQGGGDTGQSTAGPNPDCGEGCWSKGRPEWPEEESFFGRHGASAFAITLAVAILLLFALLMVIFMPRFLACRSKSVSLNGGGDKMKYKKSTPGIEEMAPMTLLTDGNPQSSEVQRDEDTAMSAQSENKSFVDDKDQEVDLSNPGVSTFLMRQSMRNGNNNKDVAKTSSLKEEDREKLNGGTVADTDDIKLDLDLNLDLEQRPANPSADDSTAGTTLVSLENVTPPPQGATEDTVEI